MCVSKIKNIKNKKILATILILVIAVSIFFANQFLHNDANPIIPEIDENLNGINYNPPTAEEQKETEAHKNQIADSMSRTNSVDNKKNVPVVITYWGINEDNKTFESSAYANTLATSGTCTMTLNKGFESASVTIDALPNVSTMSCGDLSIDLSELSKGTWQMTVTYSSDESRGTANVPVDIP